MCPGGDVMCFDGDSEHFRLIQMISPNGEGDVNVNASSENFRKINAMLVIHCFYYVR